MSPQQIAFSASDKSFSFHHTTSTHPRPENYPNHYEKGYEIFLFISGKGDYIIEGNKYTLSPYTLLIMNTNELHRLNISEECPYERCVLVVQKDFFPPFSTQSVDLFQAFKLRALGQFNQVDSDIVLSKGFKALFEKLQAQCNAIRPENEILSKCYITEILLLLNSIYATKLSTTPQPVTGHVKMILEYINANLHEALNLDSIAEMFFLSKHHLCHIFKQCTGYSINKYIIYKRVLVADGLISDGITPTQACYMCGFNDYSNFYKAYRKHTGKSPKQGRKA
ncbi:MAG: AraC family transcriptional regulator [Hyphomonadaceae bacterium]|nr:AraC family transcriptional regulator [Clostridia bacterium]